MRAFPACSQPSQIGLSLWDRKGDGGSCSVREEKSCRADGDDCGGESGALGVGSFLKGEPALRLMMLLLRGVAPVYARSRS